MTRMIIGVALVLVACAHQQQSSGVTTTSVTIPNAAGETARTAAPTAAPEPQSQKVESSGVSMDVKTDLGTTADGRISDAIYAGILADPKLGLAAQEIDVTTRDGNVVLSGRVHTDAERAAIEERARNTAGVKSVDDRLEVMP
jgi:osmotically-inducible protein OsmY